MIQDTTALENADERQTSKADYQVEQVRLMTQDGVATRFFGNRRVDTGEVFATTTDRYEIMQNEHLFDVSEQLFKENGLTNYDKKIVVTHGGAKARAVYRFKDLGIKVGRDDLTFALMAQNSFDGSLKVSFQVGMFRLICSNGLTVPQNTIALTKKHTSSLNLNFAGSALKQAINQFHTSAPLFQRMAETPVSQVVGVRIIDSLVKTNVMSERLSQGIRQIWEVPTHREDADRSLWNLYNATTQHLTHDVANKRFELAERTNARVLNAFTKAIRSGGVDSLLVGMN